MMSEIEDIIEIVEEISDDSSVPKNVRLKLQNTVKALKEDTEISIRVNKALHELDEISDDTNLQPYTRTQIWNVVSLLEKL